MFRIFKSTAFSLLSLFIILGIFAQQSNESSGVSKDYQLMPSDMLRVMVHQEDDLTREVSVSQDHSITLPLIGNVDVRNKSVQAVEDTVRDLYGRDYLKHPQVTIIVLRYSERVVSVMGAVNQPGPVLFPQERTLTLIEAIARAGGVSRLGNPAKVRLTRVEEGISKTYIINVQKMIESSESSNAWPLQIGDVIFVPERIL